MKIIKKIKTMNVIVALLMLISCQEDIDIDTSTEDTNNSESVFTSRAERVSMFDGSLDDVLDNSPCFAVDLPVTVFLNGIQTIISSQADVNAISAIDVIEFTFPIRVTNYEYNRITLVDQAAFDTIVVSCEQLIADDEAPITCIDFNYPILIFTSTDNQSQNDFTIQTDQELYVFLSNLGANDFYSLRYPVSITVDQSENISVNSDREIGDNISKCIN